MNAEGWYADPFGKHEGRWFSDGNPTVLVRDGSVESHDEPPGTEFDQPLIPAADTEGAEGMDLLRADSDGNPGGVPGDGAFQAFGASGGSFTRRPPRAHESRTSRGRVVVWALVVAPAPPMASGVVRCEHQSQAALWRCRSDAKGRAGRFIQEDRWFRRTRGRLLNRQLRDQREY